jgi:hypothetical protein
MKGNFADGNTITADLEEEKPGSWKLRICWGGSGNGFRILREGAPADLEALGGAGFGQVFTSEYRVRTPGKYVIEDKKPGGLNPEVPLFVFVLR